MTKLTSAQAYANQVRADRRAAALERRSDVAVKADNLRVAQLYPVAPKAALKVAKTSKRVAWTAEETDLLISLYLQHVDPANRSDNRTAIAEAFAAQYPARRVGSVHLAICRIKQLDAYYPADGMADVSQLLLDRLYAADPVRFPGGATREEKVLGALDLLLAEVQAA